VITIKSDQKEAKRCYENSLKTKRGVFTNTTRAPSEERVAQAEIARAEIARERRHEQARDLLEREIGGRMFKLGKSLGQGTQDQIAKVATPGCLYMVRLGHAWHPMPSPYDGPPGPTCPLEKKKVQQGEAAGH